MACSRCGSTAPPRNGACVVCGARLTSPAPVIPASGPASGTSLGSSSVDEPETQIGTPVVGVIPGATGADRAVAPESAGFLSPGQDFGTRYHIIRLLGAGGMGAVYQAWDRVLEVAVAVKIIRPQAAADPEAARVLERRFKRELLLARQVTHKHVVRIHDLGEIDGITYITMPYVQGSDLATVLRREGKLPVDRALAISRQIAGGLEAAHDAGVVHRDLKPANIMIDADTGGALIMDFGIAHSTTGEMTMTVAGGVGTIEYMAPEQVHGENVDQRADVYAFGLILNDMLLGRRQTGGATAVAELMSRVRHAPASLRSIDPSIPVWIDALVTKCLAPDPAARYQRIRDVLAEIDATDHSARTATGSITDAATMAPPQFAPIATSSTMPPISATSPAPVISAETAHDVVVPPRRRRLAAGVATLVGLVLAVGFGIYLLRSGSRTPAADAPAISLAVLPFKNASGDPGLDSLGSSLSQVLGTELGQSTRVRSVSADRVHQVLQDLQIAPNATLAPDELARVADLTSARRVLWGQYSRFGDAIRIDATLQDLDRGKSVPLNAMAPNESALLGAIAQLSDAVRENLARGSSDVLTELKATAWKPSTTSFEALRAYNDGMLLSGQGSYQEALKSFEAAIKQDGNFALAYSALARTYSTLGYDTEAAQNSNRAMGLADALPPYERYLISANHYRIVNDSDKAIDAYENLVKASPNSATVLFDLGGLYEQKGELDKARSDFARVVALDPKFVEGLLALGRVDIKRGHAQDALTPLNGALTLAIQLKHDEARANILQAVGIAYKQMDRPDEAIRNYRESFDIKQRLGNKRGMAASLSEIAQIQEAQGKPRDAEQSYHDALKLQREIGDKAGIATSLVNLGALLNETLGRPDDALPLLQEALKIRRDAGNPANEARVLNNIGNVYLAKGQYSEAQTYFERTLELREKAGVPPGDMADSAHNLGETFSKEGKYDEALAQYLRALSFRRTANDKRGAAIESYSTGNVFDEEGRFGAAVKAKEEALQSYRALNQRDVWLAEILSGYGKSLGLAGRTDDASKPLEEALSLARELQNPVLIAQTLRFQASRLYYAGDTKGAATLADQAVEAASHTSDKSLQLLSQAGQTILAAVASPTTTITAQLSKHAQDADSLGLPALAVECGVYRADALLRIRDRANGAKEADRALARAETLGLRLLVAKAHYFRAEALRMANDAEARREYAMTVRLLTEISREDGNNLVLKRADVAALFGDATAKSAAAKF